MGIGDDKSPERISGKYPLTGIFSVAERKAGNQRQAQQ
jgi:hypothetical protein